MLYKFFLNKKITKKDFVCVDKAVIFIMHCVKKECKCCMNGCRVWGRSCSSQRKTAKGSKAHEGKAPADGCIVFRKT